MGMSKGGTLSLYRLDRIDASKSIVITEGEIDALTCVECGHPNAVSVPNGAPAGGNNALQLSYLDGEVCPIKWPARVIIATDGDAPGERLRDEITRRIGPERACFVSYPAGCKDLNDVLMKYDAEAVGRVLAEATPAPVSGIVEASSLRRESPEEVHHVPQ